MQLNNTYTPPTGKSYFPTNPQQAQQQGQQARQQFGGFLSGLWNATKGALTPPPQQTQQPQTGMNSPSLSQLGGLNWSPTSLGQNLTKGLVQAPKQTTSVAPITGGQTAIPKSYFQPQTTPTSGTNLNIAQPSPVQQQLASVQGRVSDLQSQKDAMQRFGLTDTSQLTKDASGNYVPTTQAAATITNPFQAGPATYGGYVGALGNAPQQYAPTYQQATQGLMTAATNPNVQQAYQNIQNLQNEYANTIAQIGGTPGLGQQEAQGTQGLVNQQYQTRLAAAQGALQNALQQAQLEQSGYAQAGGLAQGQQQLQQAALTGAAGFAAPQLAPYGQGYYLPTQAGGPSGGQPVGTNGSGPAIGGSVETQRQQGAAVQNMIGTQRQAQSLATNLSSLMNSANINPANASVFTSFINGVNQWINDQSGDPQYQNFANLINEISSRYASILNQAGGTPTDQSQISHAIINGLANHEDIQTVLQSLDKNATDSIAALKSASMQNVYQNQGTTNTSGSIYDW